MKNAPVPVLIMKLRVEYIFSPSLSLSLQTLLYISSFQSICGKLWAPFILSLFLQTLQTILSTLLCYFPAIYPQRRLSRNPYICIRWLNSEHVADEWSTISFFCRKTWFVTALNMKMPNRSNNRDCSLNAHLFLMYITI